MEALHETKLKQLELKANQIRQDLIKMLLEAGSGHSAGPLGMADIFTALYFHILKHDSKHAEWPGRDRLVLSNGHICPIRYVAMAHAGYFPISELKTLRKLGSRLQGHPHRLSMPGLETTSGPLGSGLSQASGIALAFKMDNLSNRVYCAMSDGEHDAGQTWEAVMFAAKYKLNNLVGIIDRNNIQIDGFTEDIMPLDDLKNKYESFNWHVLEIDGHNMREFVDACAMAETIHEKPTMIIARTIPGKGVDFMENKFEWHGKPPNREEADIALRELRTLQGQIEASHID
ncbi:MAG: transketolase [Patescibacteria group bacterium]